MSLLLLMLLQLLLALIRLALSLKSALPNCADHCGEVQIPYPFGIGHKCYHDKSYEISCNNSFNPPKPFLPRFNVEVLDINWPRRYPYLDPRYNNVEDDFKEQTLIVGLQSLNLCQSDETKKKVGSRDFKNSPFVFSSSYNVLMVEGCGGKVVLKNRTGHILTACVSVCDSDGGGNNNKSSCYGVGCCQAPLLSPPARDNLNYDIEYDIDFYEVSLDFEELAASNSCNITATLIESTSVKNFNGKLQGLLTFPTVLEWEGPYTTNFTDCVFPYEGNPYLPNGCQLIAECFKCIHNPWGAGVNGSTCFPSSDGPYNAKHSKRIECDNHPLYKRASFVAFSSGMGLVLLVLGGYWLYRYLKRRREIKRKADNFKRNGGLLLQQQLCSEEGVVERAKVYTVTELEKATDNFNENRILGQGGQGTVYKGMLMDGRIVAIKKSKRVDETQVEPFINEVVILSQINHRNVVGLMGCCLETDVPILVYEFITNGTLYEHIQGADDAFHITWKMRLQIAAESAGAIAYLHSSSSAPIYHRDIKSTNILLDEKYRAKVSDFGTSRAITIEQTHVTTAVQGTYGYLDPEYFQSNQFTEKSDVYSFGVVLVELLTGKKPIIPVGNGSWLSLAVEFLSKMEDSHLSEILDSRILDEGKESEFIAVAKLARKCLNMNGKLRPTMKEISVKLDAIRSSQMMSISEEAKTKENSQLSRSTAPLDDDPLARSIEIQPLMSRT